MSFHVQLRPDHVNIYTSTLSAVQTLRGKFHYAFDRGTEKLTGVSRESHVPLKLRYV